LECRLPSSKSAKKGSEDPDKPGQLLLDIVDFKKNHEFAFRWEMGGDLAQQGITESNLADIVLDLIRKDEKVRRSLADAAGYPVDSLAEREFIDLLEPALSGDLFRVVNYAEILSKLGG
jgi:hypothetical protein